MSFEINQVVYELEALLGLAINQDDIASNNCIYPKNVEFQLNKTLARYHKALKKILINPSVQFPEHTYSLMISWQILQAHRIAQAIYNSDQACCVAHRVKLLYFIDQLQTYDPLASTIFAINLQVFRPTLVCSGHSVWDVQIDGYVDLTTNPHQRFYFYSPFNSSISYKYAKKIECGNYEENVVCVSNKKKQVRYYADDKTPYPLFFNANHIRIPNFILDEEPSKNERVNVIEVQTGRIWRLRNHISLSEVATLFPRHDIHWAACTSFMNNGEYIASKSEQHFEEFYLTHKEALAKRAQWLKRGTAVPFLVTQRPGI